MKISLASFLLLLFICNTPHLINAQSPFDCINAIQLCDSLKFRIKYDTVIGTVNEDIDIDCEIGISLMGGWEENTVWFKFIFETDGDFVFTLTPSEEWGDLDFVVYTSPNNDCFDLEAIRCMYSGETQGGSFNSNCEGQTGLSRLSDDLFEDPGCQSGDDNFLAAVDVKAGDVLFLAVHDFTGVNEYELKHGGSAQITCLPLNLKQTFEETFLVYPNPAFDFFSVEWTFNGVSEFDFELFNLEGEIVRKGRIENRQSVKVSDIPTGVYFFRIYDASHGHMTHKLMVAH